MTKTKDQQIAELKEILSESYSCLLAGMGKTEGGKDRINGDLRALAFEARNIIGALPRDKETGFPTRLTAKEKNMQKDLELKDRQIRTLTVFMDSNAKISMLYKNFCDEKLLRSDIAFLHSHAIAIADDAKMSLGIAADLCAFCGVPEVLDKSEFIFGTKHPLCISCNDKNPSNFQPLTIDQARRKVRGRT